MTVHEEVHKEIQQLKDRLTDYPDDNPTAAFARRGAVRRYKNRVWDHLINEHGRVVDETEQAVAVHEGLHAS